MLSQTSRAVLRRAIPRALPLLRSTPPQRTFILSPPAGKRGTWKGTAIRWGLVIGGVYWYSTTTAFAEDNIRHDLQQRINELPIAQHDEGSTLPTLEDISATRKQRFASAAATSEAVKASTSDELAPSMSTGSSSLSTATSQAAMQSADDSSLAYGSGSPTELEEEASQQGAFNEETGEINWDCPCLGGMAYGPCGPEFREAFSCFVYSKDEPKGIDCIDRFKGMQECFRKYPEHYGAELADEEDPSMDELPDASGSDTPALQSSASGPDNSPEKVTSATGSSEVDVSGSQQQSLVAKGLVQREHGDVQSENVSAASKEWRDTRGKNEGKKIRREE